LHRHHARAARRTDAQRRRLVRPAAEAPAQRLRAGPGEAHRLPRPPRDQFDLDHVRLADMNQQLVKLQEEKADMRDRAQQARQILASGGTLYAPSDFEANGQVQRLRAELREGEAQLKVLATQYGEQHPNYQRQVEANRVHRQELQRELAEGARGAENLRKQGAQRERELESELAAQRTKVLSAKQSRDELV